MSVGARQDPLRGFNFQISLTETQSSPAGQLTTIVLSGAGLTVAAGFQECSGLDGTLDMHEQAVGGVNDAMLRFPTRVKWPNVVLKRGITDNALLWTWFEGFAQGKVSRRDGVIVLRNERHEPQVVWGFKRGLPVKYSGPALNAQQSAVAIESVEIAHEGLYHIRGASGLASAARAVFDALT